MGDSATGNDGHHDGQDVWDRDRAARWVRNADVLERQLAPISDLLFAAADLRPGERVLDVGCGTGPTTRTAATAVGPDGAVTGLDVVADMLDAARSRPVPAGAAPIEWVHADATSWEGPAAAFDVVLSRFGVMFFAEPARAFANLCRRAAPGGRLHVTVWADRRRSEVFELPLAVTLAACRRWGLSPEVPAPDAAAFSLGEPGAVTALLEAAGWEDVTVEDRPLTLVLGGGLSPEDAAPGALELGPTRVVSEGLDEEQRRAVEADIAEAYRDHVNGAGHVALGAVPIVVSARRPA